MGFSKFFINRPKFAFVISIVITLAGVLALMGLPVAQFPEITPPTVSVSTQYAGASAEVVEQTVAAPDRAGGQRGRGHDLHVLQVGQRRALQPDGDLRGRHGRGHGPGQGAEPGLPGHAQLPEEVRRQG